MRSGIALCVGGVYYLGRRRLEANPHKWVALQAFSDAHYQQSNDSCTNILYTDSQILLAQTIILLSLLKSIENIKHE